jgi:hypothetical protein
MANFLTVLKKIGQGALAASTAIPIYGQAIRGVTALIPGDKDDAAVDKVLNIAADGLVTAQNIILQAEAMGAALGVPGADKAKMSAPAIHQLLMSLPILKGKHPKDQVSALAKAEALGGALAAYLNEYEG